MNSDPPKAGSPDTASPNRLVARARAVAPALTRSPQAIERRLPHPIRSFLELIRRVAREFDEDDCVTHAAAISYHTFFAMFPLLLGAGVIVSFFPFGGEAYDAFVEALNEVLPGGESLIAAADADTVAFRGLFGAVAFIALLWSASRLFTSLRRALTVAWDVDRRHHPVHGKALDLFAVLALPGLALVSVALSGLIESARFVVEQAGRTVPVIGYFATDATAGLIGRFVPLAVSTLAFSLAYIILPNIKVPWKQAFPGAILAAILFELLKIGFAWYATNLATFNVVYGSLGTVIAVMLWIYLSAIVLLIGAEFTTEIDRMRHGDPAPDR
jgi:membrane protein